MFFLFCWVKHRIWRKKICKTLLELNFVTHKQYGQETTVLVGSSNILWMLTCWMFENNWKIHDTYLHTHWDLTVSSLHKISSACVAWNAHRNILLMSHFNVKKIIMDEIHIMCMFWDCNCVRNLSLTLYFCDVQNKCAVYLVVFHHRSNAFWSKCEK